MTNPLVAATTYNKLAVPTDPAKLPDFLTREHGKIESALKFATSFVGTTFNVLDYGVDPRGLGDQSGAFNRALLAMAAGDTLYVPPGRYRIEHPIIVPTDDLTIYGAGDGSLILSVTEDSPAIQGTGIDGLSIEALALYGPGIWSSTWTGNEGHDERGIYLTNATNVWLSDLWVRNFGHSQIALRGSCSGQAINCRVVGTNLTGSAIPSNANFQMGVFVTYGPSAEGWGALRVVNLDASESAQGFLIERGTANPTGEVQIVTPYLHDIPGQHGIYCQAGNVSMTGVTARRCDLAAVKVQTGLSSTADLANVIVSGLDAEDCAGNAVEIAGLDDVYSIRNVTVTGNATTCDRMISIVGRVDGVTVGLRGGATIGHGAFIGDNGSDAPANVDLTLTAQDIGKHGVYVSSNAATNITIRPSLLNVGSDTTNTYDGVNVEGDTTGVTIVEPRLVDTGGDMRYGIFQSDAVGSARVIGRPVISGEQTDAVRAVGTLVWDGFSAIRASAATTTAECDDGTLLIDATAGARTANLLPAEYVAGRIYTVKKTDASGNAVTVDASGSDLIDGAGTFPLAAQYDAVTIQSDGADWWVLSTV